MSNIVRWTMMEMILMIIASAWQNSIFLSAWSFRSSYHRGCPCTHSPRRSSRMLILMRTSVATRRPTPPPPLSAPRIRHQRQITTRQPLRRHAAMEGGGPYEVESSTEIDRNATSAGTRPPAEEMEDLLAAPMNRSEAEEYAQALKERALQLRAEARAMEAQLQSQRSHQMLHREQEMRTMLDRLFSPTTASMGSSTSSSPVTSILPVVTAQSVAQIIRQEQWTIDQVVRLMEILHQTSLQESSFTASSSPSTYRDFQMGDIRNAVSALGAENPSTQAQYYMGLLLEAAALLDQEFDEATTANTENEVIRRPGRWSGRGLPTLQARLNEWRRADEQVLKRRIAASLAATTTSRGSSSSSSPSAYGPPLAGNSNSTLQEYMRQTMGWPTDSATSANAGRRFNVTRVLERVALIPLWVPSPLLDPLLACPDLLNASDVKCLKEQVLTGSGFFCTSSDTIPQAAVFRGNLRAANNPASDASTRRREERLRSAVVFAEIQQRMQEHGLSERVQLFLLPDPEWKPGRDDRDKQPKPVLLALPRPVVPTRLTHRANFLATRASVAMTMITCFAYSVTCYALNPKFFDSIVRQHDPQALQVCCPIFLGIVGVQAVHEVAHYLVARWRGIKTGWPVPLPSGQLGSFGCITPLHSFPQNRTALLEFALAGPLAATIVSLVLMLVGAQETVHASQSALTTFPVVPVAFLKSSFLTSSILSFLAPKVMMMPLAQPIPLHPLVLIGFSGLLSSGLNLLPIFRLDGGRACSAALGSRFGAVASVSTLLFMLSLMFSTQSGLAWAWGVMVLFFQRRPEIPIRDEVTEPDGWRMATWISSLIITILSLAPFPGGPGFL